MLLLLLVEIPDSVKQRFREIPAGQSYGFIGERKLIWKSAIAVWKEEPVYGVGPDHFDFRFRKHRDLWLQTLPRRTHNDYLQLLADLGLVGASLGALFLVAVAYGLIRAWPHLGREESSFEMAPGSTRLAWAVGAAAGILFLMIHSAVEFNLFLPAIGVAVSLLFGVSAASLRFAGRATGRSLGSVGRGLGLATGLAFSCVFLWAAARAGAESRHLLAASREPGENEVRAALIRLAISAEPANPESRFALGENLRMRSFEAGDGFETLAQEAIESLEASVRLNPWEPYTHARLAMCLDWLGRQVEAGTRMETALKLDPNNKRIVTLMGWHYLHTGDLAKAREQLERAHNRIPHARDPLSGILLQRVDEMIEGRNPVPKR